MKKTDEKNETDAVKFTMAMLRPAHLNTKKTTFKGEKTSKYIQHTHTYKRACGHAQAHTHDFP